MHCIYFYFILNFSYSFYTQLAWKVYVNDASSLKYRQVNLLFFA
jgi:hypothetical protein